MTSLLPPALLPELLEYVQANWTALFPGQKPPRTLSYVIQGTGVGKLIVFVLANRNTQPSCILKLPRTARDGEQLAHEHALVVALRRKGGELAATSLPEPLAAPMIQGWQTVVEAMLPGDLFTGAVPGGSRFNLRVAGEHLRLLRTWYVALQRAVNPEPAPMTAERVDTLFNQPIAQALRDAELRPHEIDYLQDLQVEAQSWQGQPLRLGFVHGDLRPGNILLWQGQLRVIDWQFGQREGLPLLDWFEFGFRYYADSIGLEEITGDHDAYRAAFADVFLGAHPYSQLLARETWACADALNVPRECLDLLLSMWLVDNTNKYLAFLGDRAERGYLYLMRNPPGGPLRSFRQQLRRQVYPCLLGQLAQSRGAGAVSRFQPDGSRPVYSVSG